MPPKPGVTGILVQARHIARLRLLSLMTENFNSQAKIWQEIKVEADEYTQMIESRLRKPPVIETTDKKE